MTKEESLIISAYTGYLFTKQFSEVHEYIEKVLERPVFTHELASEEVNKEIREKLKPKIIEMIKSIKD